MLHNNSISPPTYFQGSYIYIEASRPRKEGDKAIIEAGPFKANQNYCFTFFYHMHGEHIGELNVYQEWWNGTNRHLLWRNNASDDNIWRSSSLDIRSGKQIYVSMRDSVKGLKVRRVKPFINKL